MCKAAIDVFDQCRLLEGRPDPGISEKQAIGNYAIYENGYASALDAAREAVAGLAYRNDPGTIRDWPIIDRDDALAAIDALKAKA